MHLSKIVTIILPIEDRTRPLSKLSLFNSFPSFERDKTKEFIKKRALTRLNLGSMERSRCLLLSLVQTSKIPEMLLRPINSHSLLATSCLENDRGITEASSLSARQLEDSEEEEEEERGEGRSSACKYQGEGGRRVEVQ